jgi:hypothetical protein
MTKNDPEQFRTKASDRPTNAIRHPLKELAGCNGLRRLTYYPRQMLWTGIGEIRNVLFPSDAAFE